MKLNFKYSTEEDIWCLKNKGKTSNNNPNPTDSYTRLISEYGENPNDVEISNFIDNYLAYLRIDKEEFIKKAEKDFNSVSDTFYSTAESVFGVTLKEYIDIYFTVNNRCPYSIKESLFFVSFLGQSTTKTIFHELWHFYTWNKFDEKYVSQIGPEKYNDIKESLTVLINVECKDLLPEGVEDGGYVQHKDLREKIKSWWLESRDIDFVWNKSVEFLN